jgi:hypothetical protein
MPTRVLLTVDTELMWRHYAAGLSWQENYARSYDAADVGIPHQLETLARYGLKACFFVDPMPGLVYGIEPVERMVAPILRAGQEVQLHLHSFWKRLADGLPPDGSFELTAFTFDEQLALLEQARDLLVQAGAPRPIAFRAGSYAANADTLRALAALGFRYDSSHNGSQQPWPSAIPLPPRQIAPIEAEGLVEVPVTVIEDAPGHLRHLQLCAVSIAELREALMHGFCEDHPVVTIVSHSFELATRNGLRPNRTLARRFEQLCALLARHADQTPTAHFTDLDDLPIGAAAEPLPPDRVRKLGRMVEQVWANAIYERAL